MENQWAEKISLGYQKKQVGIITFYLSQMKLIEEKLDINNFPSLDIRCGTVDRFQGMEKQVIIVSLVRNNSRREIGFAKKPERINVAFSRAQELLIIVGCHQLFTENTSNATEIYKKVGNIVKNNGGLIDVSRFI